VGSAKNVRARKLEGREPAKEVEEALRVMRRVPVRLVSMSHKPDAVAKDTDKAYTHVLT